MIRVPSLLFWTSLSIAASIGLYNTSYRVHDLSQQLHSINVAIEAEQRNMHVLKAEWVYLSNPTKIEQAARKHLSLRQTSLQQVARLENLPEVLPSRTETVADAQVSGAPIALPAPVATTASSQRMASNDDHSHINTRMIIQRSGGSSLASGSPLVIARLGSRP